ncbi:hypothetical protein ACQ5JZ_09965, partial [Streptomyces sp. ZG43]
MMVGDRRDQPEGRRKGSGAVTTPRITFVVLLIGCALAAAYTTAGRLLRSLTRKAERTDRAAQAL